MATPKPVARLGMTDQYNNGDHVWVITHEDHSYAHKFIRYEECKRCNAARVIELPSGEVLGFEPEGSSHYVCAGTSNET